MKIGIISDTHDNLEKTKKAVRILEKEARIVIHTGDMVAPFTAEKFDADFEFHCVRGNNDGEWNLKETVNKFGEFHGDIGELELKDYKIGFYHGTEESIVDSMVRSNNYDYVLRGHTHKRKNKEKKGTREINPGGIAIPGAEEQFSIALLKLESGELEFKEVKTQ